MNKIYSLKYSAATGGLIAVSELAKRVSGKTNRKLVATMLSLAVAGTVNAANIDISNVWARDYLDLAQNKGIFQPGATDVTITLKNGDNSLSIISQFRIFLVQQWICPYISRHLLSLNPLLACCRRYSRGER